MTEKTAAEKLAARFTSLKYDEVSPSSRHAIKRLLLDYLGVAVAGSQIGSGKVARRFAADQGGKAQARTIGDAARVPMANAAFANAISSHSIELDLKQVVAIDVARHPDWARYHQNRSPRTYHEAQVSLPFALAVALIEGKALLSQFSDRNIRNARVKALCAMTEITTDANLPRGVSCLTTVTLRNGRKLSAQIDYPKGSIQNPMSDDELHGKFASLATPVLGPRRVATIADMAMNAEKLKDVSALMKLTSAR